MRVLFLFLYLAVDPRALFESAMAAHKAGRLAEAQRLLEQAQKAAPANVAILGNLGAIRAQRGDFAGALAAYEQALAASPSTAKLRLNIALTHFRQADFARALDQLEVFLKQEPRDMQGAELQALCLYQVGRYEESAGAYQRLLGSESRLAWWYGHGQALLRAGKIAEGQAAIQRLFELFPQAPETRLLEAQMMLSERKYAEAVAQLERLAALTPKLPAVDLWLGVAYENARRFADAKAAYAREAAASGDLMAHYALGIAAARDGHDQEAAQWLEKARPIDSTTNNVSFHLGRAYLKLGKAAQALPLLEQAIARDPGSSPPRYARVQALQMLGRAADARTEAGRIRELLRQP